MPTTMEVLFAPAEFAALADRDLDRTVCVVFDIFRATSTIVTALANGASAIIPVAEIPDALALRHQQPDVLLAGERDGLRIRADLTGGLDFDLGNSPREFTPERVQGKTIVLSTTNGSRALRACSPARSVIIGSFLNLRATAEYLARLAPDHLLLVCSGTINQASYEDVLGAGAMAGLLWPRYSGGEIADSAKIALQIFQQNRHNLLEAAEHCRNGRRLLSMPELRDDVPWCLQRDLFSMVAGLEGWSVRKILPA
ncbi:MAG TPA: 2-phosphosulfolactate phosphatase [Verrucomicrobiae bacterium]|nr:2-phosphosulfolactate phosphatase [Verrucomicrobiae bacterium]